MDEVLLPSSSYGAETIKLAALALRSMERVILNVVTNDKIREESIKKRAKIKYTIKIAKVLPQNGTEHVGRMKSNIHAKITTKWTSRDRRRPKEKPKTSMLRN